MAGTSNWTEAIERAKKHPSGQFSNTHGSTLRAMADRGIAEKLSDGLYYLTDKGWGEEPKEAAEESKVEEKSVGMDAEMREAFETAVHTPTGYFRGVSEAVLTRLADMGIAHRDVEDEDYFLTDKGWDLGTLADAVSPSGIKYRVANAARWEIPVELVDPAPDTQAPGFPRVRPKSVTISLTPNRAGVWCVSSAAVWGPKVKDGKVTTQRDYSTLFSDLMDALSETPKWLNDLCQEWADRANGWASLAGEPFDEETPQEHQEQVRAAAAGEQDEDAVVQALKEEFNAIPIGGDRVNAMFAAMFRQKYAEGAAWAIQELRASADSSQGAFEATQETDYKRMGQAFRVAANVLAKALRQRLIVDKEEV